VKTPAGTGGRRKSAIFDNATGAISEGPIIVYAGNFPPTRIRSASRNGMMAIIFQEQPNNLAIYFGPGPTQLQRVTILNLPEGPTTGPFDVAVSSERDVTTVYAVYAEGEFPRVYIEQWRDGQTRRYIFFNRARDDHDALTFCKDSVNNIVCPIVFRYTPPSEPWSVWRAEARFILNSPTGGLIGTAYVDLNGNGEAEAGEELRNYDVCISNGQRYRFPQALRRGTLKSQVPADAADEFV